MALLSEAGWTVDLVLGSGRWFRPLQIVSLLLPGGAAEAAERWMRRDGERHIGPCANGGRYANVFARAHISEPP